MDPEKSFFKYVDATGATATLTNRTLLFSSPLYFNDPFDISIQTLFGYEPFDFEAYLDAFVRLATSAAPLPEGNGSDSATLFIAMHSKLSQASDEDKKNLRKSLSPKDIWDEESLRANGADLLVKIKAAFETSGIFCASKRFDNYLLWAHYADKHRGAVLEFAPNVAKDSMLRLAQEVEYTNTRPHLYESHEDFLAKSMFRKTDEILTEFTKKVTMAKSLEWAYEEEVRIYYPMLINIFAGKQNCERAYHDDELRSVYLGCKMDPNAKQRMSDLARRRNPSVLVYEMIPDPHHYKLEPRKFE